jgi:parallel beta-helix repeat protein
VVGCRARGTQNGLLLSQCDGARAEENDFSFLSGWGIALWRSREVQVLGNRVDFCVRGYSHGVYARGQDSAAILVFEQCRSCVIERNSGTHSGDGLFLYAGNESLKRTGEGGCNDNTVASNDFSHAVANGIEATFSTGNSFSLDRLDDCEHGVWAGYSSKTKIRGNQIHGCANGISIEHGRGNEIMENSIAKCRVGIHLWWDEDPDLVTSRWGRAHDTSSSANTILLNTLTEGGTAFLLERDRDSLVFDNFVKSHDTAFEVRGDPGRLRVERNDVEARLSARVAAPVALSWGPGWWKPWKAEGLVLAGAMSEDRFARPQPAPPPHAGAPGGPYADPSVRQGRDRILVGEWGPLDPAAPALFPATQSTSGTASVHVLGDGKTFQVSSVSDGFRAEPAEGTAPAVVRVARSPAAGAASVAPFALRVRIGDEEKEARGTLLSTRWTVRFWKWEKDPRTDAAAHTALLATPPLDTLETDRLDFAWGAGAPTPKVPADRFATVAETTVTLPAGAWRLVTTSDDGIRVLVDGKVVLEDWTWHAPTEHAADFLSDGKPHAIRIEHFELDGYAVLRLSVEAVTQGR